VPATSVHALPRVCRRLAFLCPTWQRPSSSKMASMRARSPFLLENSALKFDLSGVGRRSKHDILQSFYQLGEFHHLYNDLRKDSTKFFEYCRMSPSTFDYIVQATRQYISHISTNFQKTISVEEAQFVTLMYLQRTTHLKHFIPFRDGASLVHSKTATFIMTQIHW